MDLMKDRMTEVELKRRIFERIGAQMKMTKSTPHRLNKVLVVSKENLMELESKLQRCNLKQLMVSVIK
jgi:hypothetical protein